MNNMDGRAPVWLFNGEPAPVPMGQLKISSSQQADVKKNAGGKTIAQKINRRIVKYDSVQWSYLTYDQWRWIRQHAENYAVDVTYWDELSDAMVTRKFYFGDTSATPYEWDAASHAVARPLSYINCAVNITDMGW